MLTVTPRVAPRQHNICCSPAPSTSHSEKESGQTTLPYPASSVVGWVTCDALPSSPRRLEFPSDEREEEEEEDLYDSTRKIPSGIRTQVWRSRHRRLNRWARRMYLPSEKQDTLYHKSNIQAEARQSFEQGSACIRRAIDKP